MYGMWDRRVDEIPPYLKGDEVVQVSLSIARNVAAFTGSSGLVPIPAFVRLI